MTVLLALFVVCLGVFFLNVFFQIAKMERRMHDQVTALEKYMTQRYNLSDSPAA